VKEKILHRRKITGPGGLKILVYCTSVACLGHDLQSKKEVEMTITIRKFSIIDTKS